MSTALAMYVNVETQTRALCRQLLLGVLMSKHKLELNVDSFVGNFFHANGGLVTKNSGPLRAREGEVRLG